MATTQIDSVIHHLRRVMLRQGAADRTDGQLLASFIEQKDEAAFEALVHRHGPMVWGVCRRVIGNHHDAEDAFQATFLVLARKASSVRPREKVANWLHGVALRTAMKAKAMTAKRRGREKQVTEMPEPEAVPQDQWHDLQPLLDRELNGLPENYRLPILLCDLEGKTIKDAAQQLGWPQGSLAGRLARGRKLLAKRLASRGVALSAGSLAAIISRNVASAGVPASLMSTTVKAAAVIGAGQAAAAGVVQAQVAALMEGVLKIMFMTKLMSLMTVTMAMLAIVAGVGGVGLLGYGRATGQQKEDNKAEVVAPNKEAAKSDKDQLLGKWRLISCKHDGKDEPEQPWCKDALLVIEETDGKLGCKTVFKDKVKLAETFGEEMEKRMLRADLAGESPEKAIERFAEEMEKNTRCILKLDGHTKPKTLDVFPALGWAELYLGIYKLDGDTLTWCWSKKLTPQAAKTGKDRPTDFLTTSGDGRALFVYKRQKETEPKSRDSSPVPAKKADAGKTDLDRLQGVWSVVSIEENGGKPSKLEELVFMVDGKRACLQGSDSEIQGGLYLEPTAKPKTFDLATSTRTIEGIYSLEGDTLRLCYDGRGVEESKRPGGFLTEKGSPQVLLVLKRTHGAEVFPFRRADGTRAFPTIIEEANPIPPRIAPIAPQPKDAKPPTPYMGADRTTKAGRIFVIENTKKKDRVILKQPTAVKKDEESKSDMERLQGTWKVVSEVKGGENDEEAVGAEWTFKDRMIRAKDQPKRKYGAYTSYLRFRLDQTTNPKRIDFVDATKDDWSDSAAFDKRLDDADLPMKSIYAIADDTLTICISMSNVVSPKNPIPKKVERPSGFKTGLDYVTVVLKRQESHPGTGLAAVNERKSAAKAAEKPEGDEPKAPKLWTLEGELKVHPKYLYRYYLVLGNGQMCALYGSDHGRESAQLGRLKLPIRVRVRGMLGTGYHAGGTKDNPSPFPPTWTLYMDVHEVEALK